MGFIAELSKLKGNETAQYFWLTAGLSVPGASYLFFVDIDLFISLGTPQIIFMAVFYSILPVFLAAALIPTTYLEGAKDEAKERLVLGGIYALFTVYITTALFSTPVLLSSLGLGWFLPIWYALAVLTPVAGKIEHDILPKITEDLNKAIKKHQKNKK